MRILILLILALSHLPSYGTTLINANFESSTSATLANDSPNRWCRGTAAAFSGNYSLYISGDNCATNTYQGLLGTSISHAYWTVNFPAGETNINLSFNWRCSGEAGYDDLRIYYQTTNPVAGTLPSGTQVANFLGQTSWQSASLNLPASLAGQSGVRIIFTWRNDWNLGSEPPAAIDNVVLTTLAPAAGASCANPIVVNSFPYSYNGNSAGMINDYNSHTGCGNSYGGGEDVVFRLNIPSAGAAVINLTNTSGTGWIGFFLKGSADCANSGGVLACAVSGSGNTANTNYTFSAPGTYFLIIDYWPAPNNSLYSLNITFNPSIINDECAGAITLTPGVACTATPGTTSGATASSGIPTCVGTPNNDVWYKFTATANQHIINVEGESNFDAVVQAFSGSCGSLSSIGCRDNTFDGEDETLTLSGLTVGQTYYIRVYHYYSAMPTTPGFKICVTTNVAGANCFNPIIVGTLPYTHTGSTASTGNSYGAQSCSVNYGTGNDVVYRLDAAQAGRYNINVTNTSGTGWIGWFAKDDGLCSNTSASVACAVSGSGNIASGFFDAPGPGTYYIIIDYWPSPVSSNYSINITRTELTPGVNCGLPLERSAPFSHTGTTCGSGNDYAILCDGAYGGGEDFVYRISIPQAGEYFFHLNNIDNSGWVTAALKSTCDGECLMNLVSDEGNTASGSYSFSAPGNYLLILDSWPLPNCYNYSLTVSLPPAVVWPGDADNDGTVTAFDLFLAASGYGLSGPTRTYPGSNWQGYAAGQLWANSTLYRQTTVNNVFLDANGDGAINLFDVALTVQHRGLTR